MLKKQKNYFAIILLFFITIHFKGYAQFDNIDVTNTTKTGQLIVGNRPSTPSFVNTWFEGTTSTNLFINNSANPVDQKIWSISNIGGDFKIFTEKDDFSAIEEGFIIKRGNGISISQVIFPNGNIGIGTNNPDLWKLAVNGKIRAKEIKVETGWSDFVFFEDYELPTLEEVENHIKEKGHLKNIPSAKEVAENGIFLGQMDSKLLQKIEELTLYTIQQQKEIEELKLQNQKLLEFQLRLEKLESKK